MRRIVLGLGVGVLVLPVAAVGGLYWKLSNPTVQVLELPADEIAIDSPDGQRLLDLSDAKADFAALDAAFESQEKLTWCGVASSTTVLKALSRPVSQRDYFDRAPRSWWRTTFSGMPIADVASGLRAHGAVAEEHFAEDLSLDEFRRVAGENLRTPGDYLIVNYDRRVVGQEGGGHISPLGAYHADTDRFLLLDVSAYKYPPMWIEAADLWAAMDTPDSESGRSRGFVVVR